jgi:hypothetical protein
MIIAPGELLGSIGPVCFLSAGAAPSPAVNLLGILVAAMALLAAAMAVGRLAWRRIVERAGVGATPARLRTACDWTCMGLLLFLFWYLLKQPGSDPLRRNLFVRYARSAFPLFVWSLAALRWSRGKNRAVRLGFHLLAGALVAAVVLAGICNEAGRLAGTWDFSEVFNPVVQVNLGRALLINCRSPYGLYPDLLQPVLALGGLSVLKFTALMGTLTAASFLLLWVFLRQATSNRLVAGISFVAVLFVGWFHPWPPEGSTFRIGASCFQDVPIRLVFPAALVWLGWRYFRRPSRWLYAGILVFLSAGVLWNPESGLPTLVAWVSTLSFVSLFEPTLPGRARTVALHLGAAAGTLVGVVAVYGGVAWLQHGEVPPLDQLLPDAWLFSVSEAGLFPRAQPATVKLVFLVYAGGLIHCACALSARRPGGRVNAVFLLSALGIGLYSAVSSQQSAVSSTVWWPGVLLLALVLDTLAGKLQAGSRRPLYWLSTALLLWLVEGYAGAGLLELGQVRDSIAEQFPRAHDSRRTALIEEGAFLREIACQGEGVRILSPREAVLHLVSGIPQAHQAPDFEMLLSGGAAPLRHDLELHPTAKLFVDKQVFRERGGEVADVFNGGYEILAETATGYLLGKGDLLLQGPHRPRWHAGFKEGLQVSGMPGAPVLLGRTFSIEVLVKPARDQTANAALIGNHPGVPDHQGFVVCHAGNPGVYNLVLGTGTRWDFALAFPLAPERWNYLAIVVEESAVKAYRDGLLVASRAGQVPPVEESPLPLQLGDWDQGGRQFRGVIKEARILGRALRESDIARNQERIRQALP